MPFLSVFAFPCVTGIIAVTVIFWTSGLASQAVREGTKIFLSALLVAAIVDLWARNSSRPWSLWRFGGIYLIGLVILGIISSVL
jgi:hypothetical protein